MKQYNISPNCKSMFYTAEEIKEAAKNGVKLTKDLGRGIIVNCRLAATVSGWCTVVTDNGTILQGWAGEFVCRL